MDATRAEADMSVADAVAQPGRFAGVYKVLQEAIDSRAFPGCAFGVLAKGNVVLLDALGRFTYEDDARAVEPETLFDIASLTKVVSTTAAAMLLYQREQLDLETPVGDLLPGFVVGRESGGFARRVRLRHLLAHDSGLPGYVEFYKTAKNAADLFRACLDLPLEAAPGERSEYSDPGFILLGKALEVLTGEPLDRWVHREIFEPLGLTSTLFNPAAGMRQLIAPTEIDNAFRDRVIQGEVQDENAYVLGGVAGHAGLFSNAEDLLRFAGAILSGLDGRGGAGAGLFRADTILKFAERQGPEGSSQALGWDTPSAEGSSAGRMFSPHSIGHLGYSGCSIWIDLDAGVAAVLLTNRTWPDRANQAIRQVRPAFHDAVRKVL